ncbi:MAG: RHS repeat protein, partial [Flavobacteriaceae bacterium]|nr:RHS repeat protein [Flavobacteriaceae bacterium]
APGTESGFGKLTLKQLSYNGKGGENLVPPYKFEYKNASTPYPQTNVEDYIDSWGYYKNNPSIWSLNKIVTPTGGQIKMEYDKDKYIAEAAYLEEVEFSDVQSIIDNGNNTVRFNFEAGSPSTTDYFIVDRYHRISYDIQIWRQLGREWDFVTVENKSSLSKVSAIGPNWIEFETVHPSVLYEALAPSNCTPSNYCIRNFIVYGTQQEFSNPVEGGGIVTSSITVNDGINDIATTEYIYKNGITSYAPKKEPKGIPYASELPAPMVLYGEVEMRTKDRAGEHLGKTIYEFETLEPQQFGTGYMFSLGENFRVREDQNANFEGDLVKTNKYTIESRLGNIGRMRSVKIFNAKNHLLEEKTNTYKTNLDTDLEIGVTQETFSSYKRYEKDENETFLVSSTSKINYPSVLESTSQITSGHTITQHFDKFDFLTGQVLETRTYASDGTAFKTQTIPAYTLLQYGSGNYSMGSKLDDITNKNMLTQQAMSRTYMKVSNDWKLTGVGITTWNNNWSYRNISGNQNSPTNSDEKIWRKHRIYYWDGDRDADGAYMDFDESNDDGFNWGVGANQNSSSKWKPTSEITRYNHYSTPIEVKDINGNYTTTKTADNHSKVIAVANAKYTEAFYSGAEYNENSSSLYLEPEIFYARLRTTHRAHTGRYSVRAGVSDEFGALMKTNEHRAGKYKLSVWVHKDNYTNARVRAGGSIEAFNGEKSPAGDWVQLNHYFDLTESEAFPHVTSNSGDVYYDDLRIHPIESTMTSYVYNDFDELSHIIAPSGLATHYKYDKAGRLIETWVEVLDNPSAGITGGFKKVQKHTYNYK